MGVTKDYSVRYTVWTLFIYMSWVAIGCMIYEQKHWLEWAVFRPESGGKNCHRLCREFFRKTEQHEGQWMLKGKRLKKKRWEKSECYWPLYPRSLLHSSKIFINIEWLLETKTKKYCVKLLLGGLFHVLYQAS